MDSTISSKMRCARRCGARARLSFSEPCLLYTFRPLYQFERLSWCASGALLSLPSTFRSVFTRKRKITHELKFEARGRPLLPHFRNARLSANAVVRFVPPENTHRRGAPPPVLFRQILRARLSGGVAWRAMWNEAKGTCIRS